MADPKITLSMRGGGSESSSDVAAKVGGEIRIQYDPAKAQASIDYTSPDKVVLRLQGELSLQAIGIPAVTVAGGVKIDEKGATVSGSMEWAIAASVAAKVDLEHSPGGSSGMMTLSVKF
jgi:hypothetical protein